jgi:sugar/nucleoside kinase (ribokinase family)
MQSNQLKPIQLCAIGNGLVDMQYQISDELLNLLNAPKGEMRLVESEEQTKKIELLSTLKPNKCSGGSATNTVNAFAQFGGIAAYLTAIGDDENGKFYFQELTQCNIKYKNNVIKNTPTGTCLVLITPDAERTMLTCLAASTEFALEHLDEELIAQSEWLYLEGYKFSEKSGTVSIDKSIEIAKQNNTKISITASDLFIIDVFNEQFISALKQSDLLFCNENEAKAIAKCDNSDEAIKIISKICPNVVMTKGKDGAKVLFNDKFYEFSAVPTKLIDTTGAGDIFAGAFLFGLLNYENVIAKGTVNSSNDNEFNKINFAGKLASKAASIIVSQLGARYSGSFKDIIQSII